MRARERNNGEKWRGSVEIREEPGCRYCLQEMGRGLRATFRAREGCERSELIIPRKNGLAAKLSGLSCAFCSRWKRCSSGCKSPRSLSRFFIFFFRVHLNWNVVRKLLLARKSSVMSRAGRYSHALQAARDINNYAELGIGSVEKIQ